MNAQTSTATRSAVSVAELRRAWHAVQEGQFRPRRAPVPRAAHLTSWAPTGPTLAVVGATGSCGASTTALAVATAAGGPSRLIECATLTASGLSAAATAELGAHPSGWLQGRREDVLIERCNQVLVGPGEVPLPTDSDLPTVVDIGWELGQVLTGTSWLSEHLLAAHTVLVLTVATVPGLRRLEAAAALLPQARIVAGVLGPRRRRWPREVSGALGHLSTAIDARGDLLEVPHDAGLAVRGMDSTPLPAPLISCAARLLNHAELTPPTKGSNR